MHRFPDNGSQVVLVNSYRDYFFEDAKMLQTDLETDEIDV